MATHDPDGTPPELAPFARDAAAQLDRRVAQARPTPDFAAMLARARELDPEAVSPDLVARAEALPPVIPLARSDSRGDAAALAPFTAALRAELDGKLAERSMASIPAPPLPQPRRAGVVLGGFAAIAAAVLLAFLGPDLVARQRGDSGVAAINDGGAGQVGEARAVGATAAGPDERRGEAIVVPAPQDMPDPPAPSDAAPGPEDTPAPPAADTSVHVPADMSEKTETAGAGRPRRPGAKDSTRRPRPTDEPQPAPAGPSLEDEAQLLWQKGELVAAERKYREVLALAGTSLRAELAYGDLFALARQIRGGDGQAAVWREYLERFPDGRFADDARAGLCRRVPADDRAACWRDYLDHHPAGAHRKQAEAALADAAEAP